MPPQSMDRRDERGRAQHDAADAERDDDEVPERTTVIQKGEIEAVQTVIEPAVHPREAFFPVHDGAAPRIEIQPRPLRIRVADAQHRQRERPVMNIAIVVVRVVLLEPRRIDDVRVRHRRTRRSEHRVAIESDRRVVSDEERFAAQLRDVDLFGSLAPLKGPRDIDRIRS